MQNVSIIKSWSCSGNKKLRSFKFVLLNFNFESVCFFLSRTEPGKYQLPWSEVEAKGVCAFIWEPGRICVKPFRRVQSCSHGIISTKRIHEWKQRKHWLFRRARKREVIFFVYSSSID